MVSRREDSPSTSYWMTRSERAAPVAWPQELSNSSAAGIELPSYLGKRRFSQPTLLDQPPDSGGGLRKIVMSRSLHAKLPMDRQVRISQANRHSFRVGRHASVGSHARPSVEDLIDLPTTILRTAGVVNQDARFGSFLVDGPLSRLSATQLLFASAKLILSRNRSAIRG